MDRKAYSVLDIKAMNEDDNYVQIEGIATTPAVDRVGDTVRCEGAIFKTPMPLLWQHDTSQPVGEVTFVKTSGDKIPFRAQIPIVKEPGNLKNRIDEAIQTLKYGLVKAVSIGFSIIKYEIMKDTGGWDIKEWEWHELSLVTIPANSEALITAIKSIDQRQAATGERAADTSTGDAVKPKITTKKVVKLGRK